MCTTWYHTHTHLKKIHHSVSQATSGENGMMVLSRTWLCTASSLHSVQSLQTHLLTPSFPDTHGHSGETLRSLHTRSHLGFVLSVDEPASASTSSRVCSLSPTLSPKHTHEPTLLPQTFLHGLCLPSPSVQRSVSHSGIRYVKIRPLCTHLLK